MSSKEHLLAPQPAIEYDFKNWDRFYHDVMHYHAAKYAGDELVASRIGTFRAFMSARVLRVLGGLVRPHPRYDIESGWDDWVWDVKTKLYARDRSLRAATTAEAWALKFVNGDATRSQLWDALDGLVVSGEISSAEQRRLFWTALATSDRERLLRTSPYFDPAHPVWTHGELAAADAEQQLARAVELHASKDAADKHKRQLQYYIVLTALIVLAALAAAVYAFVRRHDSRLLFSLALLGTGFSSAALMLVTEQSAEYHEARGRERAARMRIV